MKFGKNYLSLWKKFKTCIPPFYRTAELVQSSVQTGGKGSDANTEPQSAKKQKTLMDFARMQLSWPTFKNNQQAGLLKEYLTLFLTSKAEANKYLNKYLADLKINAKILMYDALLILLKSKISGVSAHDVPDFGNLCQRVADIYWYVSPSAKKLKSHGATLPSFLNPLLNNLTRSKNKVKNLRQEILLELTAKFKSSLEKHLYLANLFLL